MRTLIVLAAALTIGAALHAFTSISLNVIAAAAMLLPLAASFVRILRNRKSAQPIPAEMD